MLQIAHSHVQMSAKEMHINIYNMHRLFTCLIQESANRSTDRPTDLQLYSLLEFSEPHRRSEIYKEQQQ